MMTISADADRQDDLPGMELKALGSPPEEIILAGGRLDRQSIVIVELHEFRTPVQLQYKTTNEVGKSESLGVGKTAAIIPITIRDTGYRVVTGPKILFPQDNTLGTPDLRDSRGPVTVQIRRPTIRRITKFPTLIHRITAQLLRPGSPTRVGIARLVHRASESFYIGSILEDHTSF